MHVERLSVWSLVRLSIFFFKCLKSVAGTVCLKCPSCSMVKTDVCHSRFFFGLVCTFFFFFFFFFTAALFHNCFLCAAENPDSELIARTPLPDGTVEEVYKYTPDDDTPIVVRNPLDVLEKVEVSSLCCCVD